VPVEVLELNVVVFPATHGANGKGPGGRFNECEEIAARTGKSTSGWCVPAGGLPDKVNNPRWLRSGRQFEQFAQNGEQPATGCGSSLCSVKVSYPAAGGSLVVQLYWASVGKRDGQHRG
jgi:hypothetical protein